MSASSENGDSSPKATSSSLKEKRNIKKAPKNKSQDENENEPREIPKKRMSLKLKKLEDYDDADLENEDKKTNGKVPLLDQKNLVIEGSRNRKTINQHPTKSAPEVKKKARAIEIPKGRGRALGRITTICNRIKALDDLMIKTLHRGLFGKSFGKMNDLHNNIMLFHGFQFKKDSDEYNEKLIDLSKKFNMQEMKILIYSFDLEMNYKSKEEAATCILDFLVDPQPSKDPKPALEGHPRRKATKRDYFEADLSNEYTEKKRKKKRKIVAKESEEESSSKKSTKKSKSSAEADDKDEPEEHVDETVNEEDNESKKPAKKRKSNQVIEEVDGEKESLKNGESQPTNAKKKKGSKK